MAVMKLELEEDSPGGQQFLLNPIKSVTYFDGNSVLVCECDRPLILPSAYSETGKDEGTNLCGLADRYLPGGSLLEPDRLPAMVNVLVIRTAFDAAANELTAEEATFAYTGVVSELKLRAESAS